MITLRLKWRVWIVLLAGVLVVVLTMVGGLFAFQRLEILRSWHWGWHVVWMLMAIILFFWAGVRLVEWALRPLAGASTVVEAIRDGDFSLRLRQDKVGGLDELAHSINMLADRMRIASLDRRESGLLIGKILDEIDLPVLAFRDDGVLTLSNPAARRLIGLRLHDGITAEALGVAGLLDEEKEESIRLVLPGGSGRFMVRQRRFRLGGVPHRLVVLAEVGGVLSAERNEAWQGLVRVMSHEINNSLSPIKSLAETWRMRIRRDTREVDFEQLGESLDLISRRVASLSRFVGIYAGLAKLPEPTRKPVRLDELAAKVCALESRVPIECTGDEMTVRLDADQIEQALINLVRNAVDAVGGCDDPMVSVGWAAQGAGVCIEVIDNGPGPPDSDNLFVPFFTTKPDGSGIGLLLVRRIAELHDGWFELSKRPDGNRGALARVWLADAGMAGAGPATSRRAG